MSQRVKSFSQEKYHVQLPVEPDHHLMRLDQFVQLYMNSFSREVIKKKILKGEVTIEGRPGKHRPSTRLHHKDIVHITTYYQEEEIYWKNKIVSKYEPEIIYEDQAIVAVSKPPFMSTHPTGKHLFECLTIWLEEHLGSPVHNVHRLDRETSGVIVFGKNPRTTQALTLSFEKREVKKCYFFIARQDGNPVQTTFNAHERLGATGSEDRLYIECYPENSHQGKHALTHFINKKVSERYVTGLAFPHTGRQHQIRAHAAYHGLPLLGDKIYGVDRQLFSRYKDNLLTEIDYDLLEIPRHALHAYALQLPHPESKKPLLIKAPIFVDLQNWLEQKSVDISTFFDQSIDSVLQEKLNC